jgi:hypothetical protein
VTALGQHESPFPYTVVSELAGGWIGYVPDRKAYVEGAYEVISARCAAGSGERLGPLRDHSLQTARLPVITLINTTAMATTKRM